MPATQHIAAHLSLAIDEGISIRPHLFFQRKTKQEKGIRNVSGKGKGNSRPGERNSKHNLKVRNCLVQGEKTLFCTGPERNTGWRRTKIGEDVFDAAWRIISYAWISVTQEKNHRHEDMGLSSQGKEAAAILSLRREHRTKELGKHGKA